MGGSSRVNTCTFCLKTLLPLHIWTEWVSLWPYVSFLLFFSYHPLRSGWNTASDYGVTNHIMLFIFQGFKFENKRYLIFFTYLKKKMILLYTLLFKLNSIQCLNYYSNHTHLAYYNFLLKGSSGSNPKLSLICTLFNFSVPYDQYKTTCNFVKPALPWFSSCYHFLSPFPTSFLPPTLPLSLPLSLRENWTDGGSNSQAVRS